MLKALIVDDEELARRQAEYQRHGRSVSVVLLDVDHFKKFNDRYGHDVGDQVLRMVAARLASAPGGCRAYRYGGEEFTIILPGTHGEDVS